MVEVTLIYRAIIRRMAMLSALMTLSQFSANARSWIHFLGFLNLLFIACTCLPRSSLTITHKYLWKTLTLFISWHDLVQGWIPLCSLCRWLPWLSSLTPHSLCYCLWMWTSLYLLRFIKFIVFSNCIFSWLQGEKFRFIS